MTDLRFPVQPDPVDAVPFEAWLPLLDWDDDDLTASTPQPPDPPRQPGPGDPDSQPGREADPDPADPVAVPEVEPGDVAGDPTDPGHEPGVGPAPELDGSPDAHGERGGSVPADPQGSSHRATGSRRTE